MVLKLGQNKKEILLLIITAISGLVVGVFLLEYYFQEKYWHDVGTRFDSDLGWAPIPNHKFHEGEITYSTNSFGFRSPEVDPDKERVVLVGDSITWGYGVNDDETLSHFLGEKMVERQVLNLGVSGYGIDQYYLNLKRHIEKLNPKVVVVIIFSGNDLEDMAKDTAYGKSKPLFWVNEEAMQNKKGYDLGTNPNNLILLNKKISRFSCANLFSKSWILSHSIFEKVRKGICHPRKLNSLQALDYVLTALLLNFKALSIRHKTDLLFVIWPAIQVYLFNSEKEYIRMKKKAEFEVEDSVNKHYQAAFAQYENYRFMKIKMTRMKLKFLDSVSVVQEKGWDFSSLYLKDDFGHLSPLGNQRLADAINETFNPLDTIH